MARLEQLEDQIRELSAEELQKLRIWFAEFDAEAWDHQFAADAASGKLNQLAERALQQHADGLSRDV